MTRSDTFESLLSINPSLSVINLWRRKEGTYLRLFNHEDNAIDSDIDGKIISREILEVNLNLEQETPLKSNKVTLKPWEIKTLKLT